MKRVELLNAFKWSCEECGTRNYESAIHSEDPEFIREVYEETGRHEGSVLLAPETVTCSNCDAVFETESDEEIDLDP